MQGSERDPSTTLMDNDRTRAAAAVRYTLRVTGGASSGVVVKVAPARATRLLVGTSPVCELVVDDRLVSRRHLALEVEDAGLRVTDLGSTNGTSINGIRAFDALLTGGEVLRIGETTVSVACEASESVAALPVASSFGRLIGVSAEMRRLFPIFERYAGAALPVLVEGESGTGKELLSEMLHALGPRKEAPFLVADCATWRNAEATARVFDDGGLLEQAEGGTLVFDEIGELDMAAQARLARVVEERVNTRRDGSIRQMDVRFIATSQRDLDRETEDGRFRADLFFRFAVGRGELPPLRKRRGDVGLLARHFWKALGGGTTLPYEAFAHFETARWPGNVRELQNAVARHVLLGELAERERAPEKDPPRPPAAVAPSLAAFGHEMEMLLAQSLPFPSAKEKCLRAFERCYVEQLVASHDGNVQRAAASSGIAMRYFQLLRARHRSTP